MRKFRRINCSFLKAGSIDTRLSLDLTEHSGEGYTIDEWQKICHSTAAALLVDPAGWYLSYFVVMDVNNA